MELWKYTQKRARIKFKDGDVLTGFVREYIDQEDTDLGYDEIFFKPDEQDEISVGEPEIKSIEVIE